MAYAHPITANTGLPTAAAPAMPSEQPAPHPTIPYANPPHATTESTLAPTSEFARYFLLALPARYIIRGLLGKEPTGMLRTNAAIGLGSTILSGSYANMVYHDMFNLFSETVAYETGKKPEDVHFNDLRKSDNRIVVKTLDNWYGKLASRLATDALFFAAPLLHLSPRLTTGILRKSPRFLELDANNIAERLGDAALGIKGVQLFAETWKREPTLFEHISALVNSKINPKNGLGQPISTGEVFDLYQHYHFQFDPQSAFHSVLDTNTAEARIWANGKPVFDRITELLNLTYSYKHATSIDERSNQPIRSADFALPKFLYLLGHDLIDPAKPAQTLMYIEIANKHGIDAVKEAARAVTNGTSLNDIMARFPVEVNLSHRPQKELAPPATRIGTRPTADRVASIPDSLVSPERATAGTLSAIPERALSAI